MSAPTPQSPAELHEIAVSTLYGELTDEVNVPRWADRLNELTHLVATTYEEEVLAVAYELAGPELESRVVAREAAASLVLKRMNEALRGAVAAAGLEDQPED